MAALAGNAELFILDEPTSGLDPLMEATFQDAVREMLTEGRTVLLSSHILAEVESLCDQVTIIREGRTVETGTLAELRHLTRNLGTRDHHPFTRSCRRPRGGGRVCRSVRQPGRVRRGQTTTSEQ